MSELPMQIYKAAMRYKTIEVDGLTLYPVLVIEYAEFSIAQPALTVMHQSLPVAMMRMPLLSALYAMDFEAASNGKPATGLFSRALLCLALSLRIGESKSIEERMRAFQVLVDRENPAKLMGLRFVDADGKKRDITPVQYANLRQIIAAQNGVKLEDDKANPDIVKAQHDMASASAKQLDTNIDDWISAISALTGTAEEEIDQWPILKFQRRSESLRRILDYLVCGFGEMNGTTWKGGNPTPHPFFAKAADGNGVLTAMGGSADGEKPAPPQAATAIRDITRTLQPQF